MYPLSEACVGFAHELQWGDIPDATSGQMKKYVLDLIGCGMAGSYRPAARMLWDYVESQGGSMESLFLGRGKRGPAEAAVLFNAAASHMLEMDDSDREAYSHPGIMVIPPVLALAERLGSSGREIITACVAGYEVMLRLGAALGPEHYKIWHTTGTTGTFGAAVAAGKLLGLSREQMGWAFGNAGTLSAGLWQFNQNGSMSKVLHAGRQAANGLLAACLARSGFSGADGILEGSQGVFAAMAPSGIKDGVFTDFGSLWRTDGVSFKPYPCCRHTHSAIDCGRELRSALDGDVGRITRLRLETYDAALRVADSPVFATTQAAKFSIRYCVAVALVHDCPEERHFHDPYLADELLSRLALATETGVCPELEAVHPYHEGCRITAELGDGSSRTVLVADPLGDPERPLSWDALTAKFLKLCRSQEELQVPDSASLEHFIETVRHLERVYSWRAAASLLCETARS